MVVVLRLRRGGRSGQMELEGKNGDPRVEGAGLKITGPRRHQHQRAQPADEQGCFAALVGKASKRILWVQPVRCQAVLAWRVGLLTCGVGEWGQLQTTCSDPRTASTPHVHGPATTEGPDWLWQNFELLLSRTHTRQQTGGSVDFRSVQQPEIGSTQPSAPSWPDQAPSSVLRSKGCNLRRCRARYPAVHHAVDIAPMHTQICVVHAMCSPYPPWPTYQVAVTAKVGYLFGSIAVPCSTIIRVVNPGGQTCLDRLCGLGRPNHTPALVSLARFVVVGRPGRG